MKNFIIATAAIATVLTFGSSAYAFDTDTQAWNLVTASGFLKPKVRWYSEVQTRFSLVDYNSMDKTILRGALGYQVTPKISLWQGFGSTPTYEPKFRNETRWYQQFLYEDKIDNNVLVNRFRFEQRDIQNAGSTSYRVRNMFRVAHNLDKKGIWQSVVSDEVFWNLNSVEKGPNSGYEQNRLFLGANKLVAPHTRFEFGYLRADVKKTSGGYRHLDCILGQINFNF